MKDDILDDDQPLEAGWYIVYLSIPEYGWLEPRYWDGNKWKTIDTYPRVIHVYARRFETQDEAEAYGGKELY